MPVNLNDLRLYWIMAGKRNNSSPGALLQLPPMPFILRMLKHRNSKSNPKLLKIDMYHAC
jgi:hypothetical protein